jgi:hypothetical protein
VCRAVELLTADDEDLLLAASQLIEKVAKARKAAAQQQQCPPPTQVLRSLLGIHPTLPAHVHQALLIPVVQRSHEIHVPWNHGLRAPLMSGVSSCRLRGWWSRLAPTALSTCVKS